MRSPLARLTQLNPLARVGATIAIAFALGQLACLANAFLLLRDPFSIAWPLLLLTPIAVLIVLGLLIASAIKGTLRATLPWLVSAILIALAMWPLGKLSWPVEKLAWGRVAARGATIVAAIEAYRRDNREPPPTLAALVPRYLAAVPGTGALAYPRFEFQRFKDSGNRTLVWYDLGSRNGQPMQGLWVYPDGPGDHAILAMTFADDGGLEEARIDRAPKLTSRPFDLTLWRDNRSARLAMAANLPDDLRRPGIKPTQVSEALGAPDGTREIPGSAWELRVPCSHGLMNWDVFFYWPSRRYPQQAYGGSIERVGEWAYVHE